MTSLSGLSFIGSTRGKAGGAAFTALNPATGEALPELFHSAPVGEAAAACALAEGAFPAFSNTSGTARGAFLRAIAAGIEGLGQALTDRVCAESGLPEARVKGETGRTCGQLRLFASLIEEGSWVDARIDHADPARQPAPKPDLRSRLRPVGPVVVFGASNFPLAFSAAGGDTASALAAGCPVIVKAHSAHPGTSEMVAGAVLAAAQSTGMPDGVFSLIFDNQRAAAQVLVTHPAITGVGFTGSRTGGLALMKTAAARPCPIPVYAEMSSVNPVFLLPGALAERGGKIAAGLHGSATMGAGQFCTNPGLIIYVADAAAAAFETEFCRLMSAAPCAVMLTPGICQAYHAGKSQLAAHPAVQTLAAAQPGGTNTATPTVLATSASAILADHTLTEEVFGPCTLLVRCHDAAEMLALTRTLEGQLTATFHGTDADFVAAGELMAAAEQCAGRLLCNGFPTGVEVSASIVHGGPYPATSDGRSTSVGTGAILRWVRAVCFQDYPATAMPPALQDSNPLSLWRTVNNKRTAPTGA